jgi:hypothetical protein
MAGLSPALLDAVDARIKAERQVTPAPLPTVANDRPQQAPNQINQGSADIPPAYLEALGTAGYRIKGQREANRQAWEARQEAFQQPIPADYAVRGATGGPALEELVAQTQHWVDTIRQPEWWVGLLAYPIAERHRSMPYVQAMSDPIFREVRRAAIITLYRQSLREAAIRSQQGDEPFARYWIGRADAYRRQLEALEAGDYANTK